MMKFIYIFLISFCVQLIALNEIHCEQYNLKPIRIDEEIESNKQIGNLTSLFINELSKTNKTNVKLETIKFDLDEQLQDYFSIDLKNVRTISNEHSVILLKTSLNANKKLDREYICRTLNLCSCEHECELNLNLKATLKQIDDTNVDDDVANRIVIEDLKLPLILNDINDNKPFFYQKEISIDLNLDEKILTNEPSQFIKIPLRLAGDLDSTKKMRVQNYTLNHLNQMNSNINMIFVKYEQVKSEDDDDDASSSIDSLSLYLNTSESVLNFLYNKQSNGLVNMSDSNYDYIVEKFELNANDPNYTTTQQITIKIKLNKLKQQKQQDQIITSNLFDKKLFEFVLSDSSNMKVELNLQSKLECQKDTIKLSSNLTNQLEDVKFEMSKNQNLLIDLSQIKLNLSEQFEKFELVLTCLSNGNQKLTDSTFISFKVNKKANKLSFNIVSAINELDIVNSTELFIRKQAQAKSSEIQTMSNENAVLTIAYVIVNNKNAKKSKELHLELQNEQYIEENESSRVMIELANSLFEINEMRNGLYSIRISQDNYDQLKNVNEIEPHLNYKLKLTIKQMQDKVEIEKFEKILSVKVPSSLVDNLIKHETETTTMPSAKVGLFSLTTEAFELFSIDSTEHNELLPSGSNTNSNTSFNMFNSVIIITTAIIIVILFGLACFVVSLSLYITSKCRKKSQENKALMSKNVPISHINSQMFASTFQSTSLPISTKNPASSSSSSASVISNDSSNYIKNLKLIQHAASSLDSPDNIMVYEYQPSDAEKSSNRLATSTMNNNKMKKYLKDCSNMMPVYSLTSASTSSNSNNQSPNNMSPVTTATTSLSNGQSSTTLLQPYSSSSSSSSSSSPAGPLFDTQLHSEQNPSYNSQWFKQNNLTKSEDISHYKSELYKQSHLIYTKNKFLNNTKSNQQQCHQSQFNHQYSNLLMDDLMKINQENKSQIYEARPIEIKLNEDLKSFKLISASSPTNSYSTINDNFNSSSLQTTTQTTETKSNEEDNAKRKASIIKQAQTTVTSIKVNFDGNETTFKEDSKYNLILGLTTNDHGQISCV